MLNKWNVLVFSYDNPNPYKENDQDVTQYNVNKYVNSVNITRSKSNVNNESSISWVGIPQEQLPTIGNWVVIESVVQKKDKEIKIPIFIGIISSTSGNIQIQPNGNVTRRCTTKVREWSWIFDCVIRIDDLSTYHNPLNSTLGTVAIGESANIPSDMDKIYTSIKSGEITSLNIGEWILNIIGALESENWKNNETVKNLIKTFKTFSSKLPVIPKKLADYLGLGNDWKEFFKYLYGWHDKRISLNENNVFKSVNDMKLTYEASKRPYPEDFIIHLTQGATLKQLFEMHLDFAHEFFTDLWYYQDGDDIKVQPVAVARDRPFIIKSFHEASQFSFPFSIFENVPAQFLKGITSLNFGNTFTGSTNYAKGNYTGSSYLNANLVAHSYINMSPEMERFGGMSRFWSTNKLPYHVTETEPNNVQVMQDWFKDLAKYIVCTECMQYRKMNMSISLKTNQIIQLGINSVIELDGLSYIGHTESVQYSLDKAPDGNAIINTQVVLSNVCGYKIKVVEKTKPFDGSLTFEPHKVDEGEAFLLGADGPALVLNNNEKIQIQNKQKEDAREHPISRALNNSTKALEDSKPIRRSGGGGMQEIL